MIATRRSNVHSFFFSVADPLKAKSPRTQQRHAFNARNFVEVKGGIPRCRFRKNLPASQCTCRSPRNEDSTSDLITRNVISLAQAVAHVGIDSVTGLERTAATYASILKSLESGGCFRPRDLVIQNLKMSRRINSGATAYRFRVGSKGEESLGCHP